VHRRHRGTDSDNFLQLEQTVTKLQLHVGYTQEQVAGLPPPLLKIRELEQENGRLQKENDELRRLLTDSTSSRLDSTRRNASLVYPDPRVPERDFKRRKGHHDGVYIVCTRFTQIVAHG